MAAFLPAATAATTLIPVSGQDAVMAVRVGTVAITVLVILLLGALAVATRMVIAGSIMVGALLGVAIGFWIGEANAPPDPHGSYTIGPSDWAGFGAVIGLLTGSILVGTVGWAVKRRRGRNAGHGTPVRRR
jgi:hypothetical protein